MPGATGSSCRRPPACSCSRRRKRLNVAGPRSSARWPATALHLALGSGAAQVPVSGTKGLYGHPLGASGALEAAITAMALDRGLLPGTCNLEVLDERCELNVLQEPCATRPEAALSTSFGFGGMNAALVLRSAEAM